MNTAQAAGKGVLVVHGDGAASWWSPLTPAVAGVLVAVGTGAVIQVDAANPSLVLGWTLQAGGNGDALGAAFGDPELASRLRVLATTGQEVLADVAPTLTTGWVRRATVAAVRQCTLRPIHEDALLLDQATADQEVGRTDIAASLFRMAVPSLLDLGDECLAGLISGGAATDIAHIAAVAAESLRGTGWEPDVVEVAAELNAQGALSDDVLSGVMAIFEQEEKRALAVAAADMGAAGGAAVVNEYFIDPIAVPPRLLAWRGAAVKDLRVTVEPGSDGAVVSTDLAESADVRSAEAHELIAYAADPQHRVMVAIAPMRVEGRTVTASVICNGQNPEDLHFGVYHADIGPEALRFDAVGQSLVEVDRHMLDAYNHHRLALAAIHEKPVIGDVEAMQAKSDEHLGSAQFAVERACNEIDYCVENHDLADDIAALLQRRREAIVAYKMTLQAGVVPPLGTAPLLTELLPAEVDDIDED